MADLPEFPENDYEYDPEILAGLGDQAGILAAESTAQATSAAAVAGVRATEQVTNNALLAAATAGVVQQSLQGSMMSSLNAQMSALVPGWQDTLAATAAATQTGVDNLAQYMASFAPMMLTMGANLAETQGNIAQSLMNGEVPQDIVNMVQTHTAETGQAFGLFGNDPGSALRAMDARDFGLMGIQLQQVGANMAGDNAQLWANPALALANMGSAAQTLARGQTDLLQSIIPDVDISQIYGNQVASLNNSNVVSASMVFEGSLQQYNAAMGWGLDAYQIEREAQAQYDIANLQYQADIFGYQAGLEAANTGAAATVAVANTTAAATQNAANTTAAAMIASANISAASSGGSGNTSSTGNTGSTWSSTMSGAGTTNFSSGIDFPSWW